MTAPFRAFVVDQTADGFQMGIQQLEQRDLPPGDVLIQVAYAALNYKARDHSKRSGGQGASTRWVVRPWPI